MVRIRRLHVNRNSTWNSWSKAGIGWRFITLQEDQGRISASWIDPPSFFSPYGENPVPRPSSSNLTIKTWLRSKKQATDQGHTFTHASICMKSVRACGVGGTCICVRLNYAHPSRMQSKQKVLDASREQVQGENHFPFTGPQEKR